MAKRGRPKGSKNKVKRMKERKGMRRRRESFEECVIMLARELDVKITPAVTFDKLLCKVKNKCRSNSAQATLKESPEMYNRWCNVLLREACV